MTDLTESLRVVGDRTAKVLASALGLHTVGDLLRHYPRRYDRRGELTDLDGLVEGEQVTVLAEVLTCTVRPMRQRRGSILEVVVTDGRGRLSLLFFHRVGWHRDRLLPGRRGLFAGKVSVYRGRRQLAHPEYELFESDDAIQERARTYADTLIPIYPATEKITSWKIAKAVATVLDILGDLPDPLPADLRARHGLVSLSEAYRLIHTPKDWDDVRAARKRLKWDEAFVIQVALAQRRRTAQRQPAQPRPRISGGILDAFDANLPFTLTDGQREVGEVISADLASDHPMHRLLQGDVGAGKTLVALRAMLQVVDAGGQAALLAPTEVLAQQHHRSITEMLGPLARAGQLDGAEQATRVALLTGSLGAAARREALLDAASGRAGIVIGTHALLQEQVTFADLGLVVIDEQHRFGVEQRDALRDKSTRGRPHVLVMTATPIPRTVAMTVYGDLDVVALRQLPAGRSPIATHVVPSRDKPHYLARAWERIREEVAQGRQAYIVCPRIGGEAEDPEENGRLFAEPDGGETAGRRAPLAVVDLLAEVEQGPLAGLRLAALHGRLAPDEKDKVMRAFAAGEIDVLVATTVVEVGVNVPNATVMMIMDADRFGVSQLHQLRGRVGRGSLPGLCLLVTEAEEGSPARRRLDAVASTTDGFALSRLDLEQRREGDILGVAQSGRSGTLRLLTITHEQDEELIGQARAEATALVDADPELSDHPVLAQALTELLGDDRAEYLEKA
ncbi:ATP-dependent DNA helicase RecG [Thermobifida fusca]|jgi:ATP-dependent DNA helicase RecG|uniref:ATP-dependent DNA helicase RecG n=2 Tax=Thermobifida fusca TaxID=2021 RepID=A0A9P2WRU2_THEFU|nr:MULTISPECIES: ATP-dependent DNA helicase RecG [Thermobifida]AAZ54684.1 ATP-dependent DNA helicase RecG [Thermobifida fusca YX]EOR72196.1 ATP-dependent DNA helicase RecG [Thermobifida fusca TM51]MBO2529457.1 ATP-dependent DNA helicase RecG [Thermobifida sp.]PPS96430.1 ATP-dependent DNA helicase RecG [Thermobifida fusca]PZN66227.1 MAG: ATP-dependent DNA helicase RecG [Thermobifida fusca]